MKTRIQMNRLIRWIIFISLLIDWGLETWMWFFLSPNEMNFFFIKSSKTNAVIGIFAFNKFVPDLNMIYSDSYFWTSPSNEENNY